MTLWWHSSVEGCGQNQACNIIGNVSTIYYCNSKASCVISAHLFWIIQYYVDFNFNLIHMHRMLWTFPRNYETHVSKFINCIHDIVITINHLYSVKVPCGRSNIVSTHSHLFMTIIYHQYQGSISFIFYPTYILLYITGSNLQSHKSLRSVNWRQFVTALKCTFFR